MADPADCGTFGRFAETPLADMPEDMRHAYDRTMSLRGLVPGPHKIWLANPALSETIVPTGAYFQTNSTLSKAEIEIATLVITGHWRAAYANHEHERIAVDQGGLPADSAAALVAGLPIGFDDSRQQVVYELASTLTMARRVPQGLFRRARNLLGDAGLVDLTTLLGWFTGVCLALNTYDVPSRATGLTQ